MSHSGFFTIPAGQPFALDLARGLLAGAADPADLARTQLWLPSRRAQRAVQAAFTELSGGKPLLLPEFQLLGESDEEALDILEAGLDQQGPEDRPDAAPLPDAIPALERQILLARQIEAFVIQGRRPSPAQAFKMAEELASLLDQLQRVNSDAGLLADNLPLELAEHWQDMLAFIRIVCDHWPGILATRGQIDPVDRQNRLIARQTALWQAAPPDRPIILAGSTGSQPATRQMMAAVAGLPRGAVIFPGPEPDPARPSGQSPAAALDRLAEDWSEIGKDAGHPLHIVHNTLAELALDPADLHLWPGCLQPEIERRRKRRLLLAEIFRPARQTHRWRRLADEQPELDRTALDGLHLLEAAQDHQQAAMIAGLMREMLEHPGKRAVLVTPDRALARMVQAELKKWQIEVDDSAGVRLSDTLPGRFLQLICETVAADFAPMALASLAKHPLCAAGLPPAEFNRHIRQLEMLGLRGPLAGQGKKGLLDRLADNPGLRGFAETCLFAPLDDLASLMARGAVDLAGLISALGVAAEKLATQDTPESGIARLYHGPAGEAAGRLLAEMAQMQTGWIIRPADFPDLMRRFAEQVIVRSPFETHPNLAILGTVEARLQSADRVILAGLNEGVWPAAFVPDHWMNQTVRQTLGLPDRKWRTALAAHDFMMLAGADEVWITRSRRSTDGPAQPSRWLARLDAVRGAAGLSGLSDMPGWMAGLLDARLASTASPCSPPAPKPPLSMRPRQFSATDFDKLISDPYSIYASKILKLRALPELDERPGAALRGSLVHDILAAFLAAHPSGPLPDDAAARLAGEAARHFAPWSGNIQVAGLWQQRLQIALDWFFENEQARRAGLDRVAVETRGEIELDLPAGQMKVSARADRLEFLADGRLVLVDYKTGAPPPKGQVAGGRATQLLVEAAIAAAGGFPEQAGQPSLIAGLEYWQIRGQSSEAGTIQDVLPDNFDPLEITKLLIRLLALWDDPDQAYLSEPDPAFRPKFSDIRHLARVREWRSWEVDDD